MTKSDFEDSKNRGFEADDIHFVKSIEDLDIYRSDNQKYFVVIGLYVDEINDMRKWEV